MDNNVAIITEKMEPEQQNLNKEFKKMEKKGHRAEENCQESVIFLCRSITTADHKTIKYHH